MSYYDQLHPWVVYRLLPNCQSLAIARFRRRNDASMYLATLERLIPISKFVIAFDSPQPLLAESMPVQKARDHRIEEGNHARVE
ncbi:hypothetical protein H6F93_18740 [Leptolyngbya sp. FACHB-671]|uniref:hypothetical protein n=1 Tax=Leptolyngbya sp. FACHB-671 TaxID=2692812 RepID=UPI00168300D7|nr:hypothetical protein [Leptolyngbya sp. FACHB-671]MBD2069536.1 hypothetical protein [Leptolyngbya sp. FACHB-671]